ncbi:MAG TPA: Fic family protein [Gaiellaceae bacterium]|nr:Fic family protein [Gaiellaceae bacterium]
MATTAKSPGVSDRAGTFRRISAGGEEFYSFHPKLLPPNPPLRIDPDTQGLLDTANQALGRLDGITLLLPDPDQFLSAYIRKEAVLSSQIEGTQSSLSDLLLFEHDEASGVPVADTRETFNYIRAMNHGIDRLRGGFPLSLRLFKEVHELLLTSGRGAERAPGEFRSSQNWIGGTRPGNARYVPPPAHEVMPAMGSLEKFLHDDPVKTPILVKAALAHAQFEIVHPFLDGNGRVGRLLITLLLCAEDQQVMSRPLLYLSLYLKRNRDAYYEHLQRIRTHGEWEEWLRFFLEGVNEVAGSAADTTRRLLSLVDEDRQAIHALGRASGSALRLHELAIRQIVFRIPAAAKTLALSKVTVANTAAHLERLGIVREVTGRSRNKLFVYGKYLAVLEEGTQVPA